MFLKIMLFFFLALTISRGQTNMLIIKSINGAVNSFKLSDVREIVFQGEPMDIKEKQIQDLLNSFTLYKNFPNPFNPSTNIQYLIPCAGKVEINIYDIQGRLVKALFNSLQPPGRYTLLWDGKNDSGVSVSSGTYFCSVSFNNKHLTNKLLLVK